MALAKFMSGCGDAQLAGCQVLWPRSHGNMPKIRHQHSAKNQTSNTHAKNQVSALGRNLGQFQVTTKKNVQNTYWQLLIILAVKDKGNWQYHGLPSIWGPLGQFLASWGSFIADGNYKLPSHWLKSINIIYVGVGVGVGVLGILM